MFFMKSKNEIIEKYNYDNLQSVINKLNKLLINKNIDAYTLTTVNYCLSEIAKLSKHETNLCNGVTVIRNRKNKINTLDLKYSLNKKG